MVEGDLTASDFRVDFGVSTDSHDSSVMRIDGYILAYDFQVKDGVVGDEHEDVVAGKFTAYILDHDKGSSCLAQDCDDEDGQLAELASTFLEEGGYKPFVEKWSNEVFADSMLYMATMAVAPEFNGLGLGLYAFDKTIKCFGRGCSLVACLPCPCSAHTSDERFKGLVQKYDLNEGCTTRKSDRARIARYWKRLGFTRIGRTDYLGFPIHLRRPDIGEVLEKYKKDRAKNENGPKQGTA